MNIFEDYENKGIDTDGCPYTSIEEMWKTELTEKNISKVKSHVGSEKKWYKQGKDYWKTIENNYNGVLGGLNHINGLDILDSQNNLNLLFTKHKLGNNRCLDCGAGVGRISKELLSNNFQKVDLLEPDEGFIETAKKDLEGNEKIGKYYQMGMEEMEFEFDYDCIWIQWVIGHLIDKDLGAIVIKDNVARDMFIVHKADCSIVRNDSYFKKIFDLADLSIVHETEFLHMPKNYYQVKFYVLR